MSNQNHDEQLCEVIAEVGRHPQFLDSKPLAVYALYAHQGGFAALNSLLDRLDRRDVTQEDINRIRSVYCPMDRQISRRIGLAYLTAGYIAACGAGDVIAGACHKRQAAQEAAPKKRHHCEKDATKSLTRGAFEIGAGASLFVLGAHLQDKLAKRQGNTRESGKIVEELVTRSQPELDSIGMSVAGRLGHGL